MLNDQEKEFLQKAIELSLKGMEGGDGGPFGCVVVKDGKIIGEGNNRVTKDNDPTAHAEVVAIRNACKSLGHYQLDGCDIYTSCEPCPMCLGAIYWARPNRVVYANTRQDAAAIDFDDEFIYKEANLPLEKRSIPFYHHPDEDAKKVFKKWEAWGGKKPY